MTRLQAIAAKEMEFMIHKLSCQVRLAYPDKKRGAVVLYGAPGEESVVIEMEVGKEPAWPGKSAVTVRVS